MRITVVGATGMVGSRVLREALNRGHHVTAVFRSQPPATLPPAVIAARGDAMDANQMKNLFADADAIVGATRPAPGAENTVTATTHALLDAAAATGIRILLVGGSAPLLSPSGGLVLDDPRYVPPAVRDIAAASAAQLDVCRTHAADWVYLSPPALLEPGVRTGGYRRGGATLMVAPDGSSRISAEDLAVAAVDEVERPGGDRHFTVGY
ncbi:NAD(P)-dependent oxidoreductase [Micromonospora andamanensis]|uniref:3-beta hydroxysteroid dehydrogenase n=1 Tax=Micromonospora andamanensis TaxID=1287068 RepID=A0ABQ4I2H2_9ACTN|nr:NAD(P)H-binding protein [Micromonospora andamanensis]GIJ12099.1 3-beta hydroxysteroid dehydrogenase [Micromonospora andamanensis]